MNFQQRLLEQLQIRRAGSGRHHRRLVAGTGGIRRKDAFWVGAVIMLLLFCMAAAGITYGIVSYLGMLDIPPIARIEDPRWGNRYDIPVEQ